MSRYEHCVNCHREIDLWTASEFDKCAECSGAICRDCRHHGCSECDTAKNLDTIFQRHDMQQKEASADIAS